MESIEAKDLEQDFDNYLDRIENGESFIITIDGEKKAVLIPYYKYSEYIEAIKSCE